MGAASLFHLDPIQLNAERRQATYKTIGSTPTLPPEGITPNSTLMETIGQTCGMESLNQEVNGRIESSELELGYQPGDCLFCHRCLFHGSRV